MITKFKIFEKKIAFGKMNLPDDIINLYNIFKASNYDLLVVGGAVRDFIKNQQPHDIDLVTNAKPDEIIDLLKNKYRIGLQGKQFGVVRVFTKENPLGIEIASYRTDLVKGRDNKGIHKKVDTENATIESDAERRDFSGNALYYDIGSNEIIDLVGGIDDIKNNVIRAVGDPIQRFEEDRLRLLRACRFASRNQSKIDKGTEDAILRDKRLRNISSIDDVSQERIIEEFIKSVDWASEHKNIKALNYYLELLKKYEMFEEMFPQLNVSTNNINTFNLKIIFALLFRNNDIDDLRDKFRKYQLPNNIADQSCFLLRLRDEIKNLDSIPSLYKEKKRIKINNQVIEEFADLTNINDNYLQAFLKFEPRIDANKIIKLGFKGSQIGEEIQKLEIEEFKKLL